MNNRKLNNIDSNNNELASFHSSVKKTNHLPAHISSTSTVSSVSISSINDYQDKLHVTGPHQLNNYQKNEKENQFIGSIEPLDTQQVTGKSIKYGELVVLGYNGCISQPFKNGEMISSKSTSSIYSKRRKSKFTLESKEKPSGVKPSTQFSVHTKQDFNNVIAKNENHSVTYTLSRTHQVIVQYIPDEKTDMFQIGRSSETAIDFIVLDTQVPQVPASARSTMNSEPEQKGGSNGQSTISRYSCRISVERQPPYTARIYAAGFDSTKRIFLGEKATKWKNDNEEFDGVTTNGVLIMHPSSGFNYKENDTKPTNEWMEVSVCGAVFNLDENRLAPCLGSKIAQETSKKSNILKDGTLIDLCGATLLWRSMDSLRITPTKQYIEMNLEYLNRLRPQCPVGFKTLVFPSSASPSSTSHLPSTFLANNVLLNNNKFSHSTRVVKSHVNNKHQDRIPMVYLKCGHIHGQHDWGIKKDNERECPLCRKVGPYVQLLIGIEPSFYCEKSPANSKAYEPFKPYAFLPCGHMASEATCRYWSQLKVPQGVTQGLCSLCPFCAAPLCKEQPVVKLILQEGL